MTNHPPPDDDANPQALARTLAHDFNNMLLAMTSCLELIRARSTEPKIADIAAHGLNTVERSAKLIERMLALSGVAAPQPKQAAPGAGPAMAPVKRAQVVLVIDDDLDVRLVLVELLQSMGYQPIEAANGSEGIAALGHVPPPDLAIVDFALPGQKGTDVALELLSRRPDLPIIFATGYTGQEPLPPRLAPFPMLRKPFRIAELAKAVAASFRA
jgi:CheY-like chemotaxis protein